MGMPYTRVPGRGFGRDDEATLIQGLEQLGIREDHRPSLFGISCELSRTAPFDLRITNDQCRAVLNLCRQTYEYAHSLRQNLDPQQTVNGCIAWEATEFY